MITEVDVKQYEEEGMFWVEGAQLVPASTDEAWKAIASVMLRANEIDTLGKAKQQGSNEASDSTLVSLGKEVIMKAVILNGRITIPIKMVISQVQQGRYCRMQITALKQHFADVDFLIEPKGERQCHIRYRQGFHYRNNFLGWTSRHLTLKTREIPETVNIFNSWEKHILNRDAHESEL
ncbi:MAG: hypothetical protein H6656_03765 [Ardenticatenaceae bacterium]|nr:hypothetical protein [Ardenticatenaceae bacterium]